MSPLFQMWGKPLDDVVDQAPLRKRARTTAAMAR